MRKAINFRAFLCFALAVGCFCRGIALGQGESTMEKAIRICLECIGIG